MIALDALKLFKRIKRLHQGKLPTVMKALGDSYVRQEFKLHVYGMKCSEAQYRKFLDAWMEYAKKLESQSTITGEAMSLEQRKLLNDEQKAQLRALRDEVEKL